MNKNNLYNLGLSERFENEASIYDDNLHLARVAVQHKDMYKVITEEGEAIAEVSGKFRNEAFGTESFPAVGDWVMVDRLNDLNGNAIIHHVLRRKSSFERKVAGNRRDIQVVAANVDIVFLCMALNNDFNIRLTNGLRNDDKGRHTTTHRELFVLPDGGIVIDTPGMRELQLISGDMEKSFSDIEELAALCKFSDCKHESEPGCAIKKAIEEGRLDEARFESYKKLQKELRYSELSFKRLEKEKINNMFGSMTGMKNAKRAVKAKNKRR